MSDNFRNVIANLKQNEKLALVCGGAAVSYADLLAAFVPTEPSALALGCSFSAELCAKVSTQRAAAATADERAVIGAIGAGLITEPMKLDAAEYFSEDPWLARVLLSAYSSVELGYIFYGMLGQGEYNIRTIDARALKEIYLYPTLKEASNAAALLIDGGSLNGETADASRRMFDEYAAAVKDDALIISRGESVTGAYLLCDKVKAKTLKKRFAREIEVGSLHENIIDKTARRTLAFAAKVDGFYAAPPACKTETAVTDGEIFSSTAVLLKNSVLPSSDENIVFFGDGEYFDDGDKFDVRSVSDVRGIEGLAVFVLTDYGNGVDSRTLEAINARAQTNKTIVALCGGAACPIGFSENVGAIIYCPYAPKLAFLSELVKGETSPRGRLPFTWCKARGDYPAQNPRFAERGDYRYTSVYNGYSYFDTFARSAVMFPFGHGLDYTEFEISAVKATCRERAVAVECDVKNVGARRGSAAVQAYISYVGGEVYGLTKRFAALERVELAAGESKHIVMNIESDRAEIYDDANGAFVPVGGKFEIDVGLSAGDIRGGATVKLSGASKLGSPAARGELPSYYAPNGAESRPLCPSAPELEKLFGMPFIAKRKTPEFAQPVLSRLTAWNLKRKTPKRCVKLLEYKLNNKR